MGCALLTRGLTPPLKGFSTSPMHQCLHGSSSPCGLHPGGFSGSRSLLRTGREEPGDGKCRAERFGLHHSRLSSKHRAQLCSLATLRGNSATAGEVNWFWTSAGASAGEQMLRGDPGRERDLYQNQLPGRERDCFLYSLSPGSCCSELQKGRMDLSAPGIPLMYNMYELLVTGFVPLHPRPVSSEIFIQDLPASLVMNDLIHS